MENKKANDNNATYSKLEIHVEHLDTFSLAAQQNDYLLFKNIRLKMGGDTVDLENKVQPLKNLVVNLSFDNDLLMPEEWKIDQLDPYQSLKLQARSIRANVEKLHSISDPIITWATLNVRSDGEFIQEWVGKIDVLPHNYWGGEARQADLLAAFVKPNGVYVEEIVRQVTKSLEVNGHGKSADGYQSGTREKPYLLAATLWNVICAQDFSYVTPPLGFAKQGQRIRLAADISNYKNTACLDTSLLFASCLECMGLNSVVALNQKHAFAGVWLIDQRFPVLTNDDPIDLRKRIDARDLLLFETTLVTNDTLVTFAEACSTGRQLISEEREADFVYVIDIKMARARQIRPLSTTEIRAGETTGAKPAVDGFTPVIIPPLPPVKPDEKTVLDTPKSRIDMWQRRLLDLTKRNPMLNHSDRAMAIKLFCPDIGEMEDLLADGVSFIFQSASESPINDSDRDAGVFRLNTGNDLHKQYAIEQLSAHVLISNQTSIDLERNAINLLRKAKNDLEESGANTLYLAMGYLRWKETPDADRSYRAPLILMPIELSRKSARAPVRLTKIQEEDALFNLTLIEFLESQHGINLNIFKDDLPEDESGVDVQSIWATVRNAVSEQKGFEVVEELTLGSFSFAKYLMWKDLHDRIEDLKVNRFVAHLVDRPNDVYAHRSSFVEQTKVDRDIDLKQVFTPLNCDSSQLVAVEASGRDQDFVLEGPPGTGKSETIANIVAHNLALGRKVLFVAEKMAALNVVYRRLEKIGLDHLCLELHSNKANKRAVLDQLAKSANRQSVTSTKEWEDKVDQLTQTRNKLNLYVAALHKKSQFGLSFRDCVARSALFANAHFLGLRWNSDLGAAPVSNETDLKKMESVVKELALAYHDIESLDPVTFKSLLAMSWSVGWQRQVVAKLNDLVSLCEPLMHAFQALSQRLQLRLDSPNHKILKSLGAFDTLIEIVQQKPMRFALARGAKENIMALGELASRKGSLDSLIEEIGHHATHERIIAAPIGLWQTKYQADESKFLMGWVTRRALNKEAVALGFAKITNFAVLSKIAEAQESIKELEPLIEVFKQDGVWQGWSTSSEHLLAAKRDGIITQDALLDVMKLVSDPMDIYAFVQKTLVDGRDFLDITPIRVEANQFVERLKAYDEILAELTAIGVHFDDDVSPDAIAETAGDLIASEVKFKPWCEWKSVVNSAESLQLQPVVEALINRTVSYQDIEAQTRTAFCRWLANPLLDESQDLREFKSASHIELIKTFRSLDQSVANTTNLYIQAVTAAKAPNLHSPNCPKELGVLSRELQKKTRHKPIRMLLSEMGESLLELTPCLMMSPISVAQFLPTNFKAFDLVVFDEASQMTVWDSVGAIARGRNVIVVGDPKQMPPTNFFNSSIDTEDPEEEDLESILDQALAARLPHRRLTGHYRSRHETLIAFSNSKYYENSLVSYPSAETKESAVTLRRVDGLYAKGTLRNNLIEAKEVVKEVLRRLSDPVLKHQSIGIVTLNSEQMRTIEDLLDEQRRKNPLLETFFQSSDYRDPIFIKNLESVQGDERDVILLSLGYGPVEPMAKTMSMNFGPLNRAGGERRLNVAITRAKHEVVVFTSFDSSMIDLTRTSAVAVEHLKHYLDFAARGPVALADQATADHGVDQFDSDFEQAVANALRQRGWGIQTQVGVTKFRIDLGVRHPDKPGVYLAGVECDGAAYHSSPSARDRDRVRQIILEGLGWRLLRLWSTDYFIDPDGAIEKIHLALTNILQKDKLDLEKACTAKSDNLSILKSPESHIDNIDTTRDVGTQIKSEVPVSVVSVYDASKYFEDSHRPLLSNLARSILNERNGIKLHTLTLEIATRHGLSRTSKKQLELIYDVIKPWAGVRKFLGEELVIWLSPKDVKNVIEWRGVEAFGYEREWSELPYPETIGLGQYALKKSPQGTGDYICNLFDLKRRHEKTLTIFKSWVELGIEMQNTID